MDLDGEDVWEINPSGIITWGSLQNVISDVNANGGQPRYNYVYFPKTGHLFHVEYYAPRYIKTINSYKDFYFGTLNHK